MGLLIILGIIFILSFILCIIFTDKDLDALSLLSGTITVISLIILVICGINLSTKANSCSSDIAKFESFRSTLSEQRKDSLSTYERATLTKEIIESNQWLAQEQFWATTYSLGLFYDKRILELKPIK